MICVEMFFAAIAHAYAFPVAEYDGGRAGERGGANLARAFGDNVRDMFDLRDVYHDVVTFSESNKDEFWAEVNFRYRAFVGIFTGSTPLKSQYSRVRDADGKPIARIGRESATPPRGSGAGGTARTERRVRENRCRENRAFTERELRSMGSGRGGVR